jgi:flagellar biosynthesis chaperone FliJ
MKMVSVRVSAVGSSGKVGGQIKHDLDFEHRPSYTTRDESNVILLGGDFKETKALAKDRTAEIIQTYNGSQDELRASLDLPEERRKVRSWGANQDTYKMGIITFSQEATDSIQSGEIDKEALDRQALEYVHEFADRHNSKILYLVRHEDEQSPHYHFMFENFDKEQGRTIRFLKSDLEAVQDLAGEVFAEVGLSRGEKKLAKLTRVADELGYDINSKEAWKAANLTHKGVRELHGTMMLDAHSKSAELDKLNASIAEQQAKIDKNLGYIESNTQKLREQVQKGTANNEKLQKLEKRIGVYEGRMSKAETAVTALEAKKEGLDDAIRSTNGFRVYDNKEEASQIILPGRAVEKVTVKTGIMKSEERDIVDVLVARKAVANAYKAGISDGYAMKAGVLEQQQDDLKASEKQVSVLQQRLDKKEEKVVALEKTLERVVDYGCGLEVKLEGHKDTHKGIFQEEHERLHKETFKERQESIKERQSGLGARIASLNEDRGFSRSARGRQTEFER